jgi:glycerol kinase
MLTWGDREGNTSVQREGGLCWHGESGRAANGVDWVQEKGRRQCGEIDREGGGENSDKNS